MGGLKGRWNWISPPVKVKILEDIKVEDLAFGWKHTIVLGTPRQKETNGGRDASECMS